MLISANNTKTQFTHCLFSMYAARKGLIEREREKERERERERAVRERVRITRCAYITYRYLDVRI